MKLNEAQQEVLDLIVKECKNGKFPMSALGAITDLENKNQLLLAYEELSYQEEIEVLEEYTKMLREGEIK